MKYGEPIVCIMNQDFFKYIPLSVREQLINLYNDYYNTEWFEEAWETYRQYILNCVEKKEKIYEWPGPKIFNKFLRQEFDKKQKETEPPISLGGGLYQCRNCGRSFMTDHLSETSCPSCGMQFSKIPYIKIDDE